MHGMRFTVQRDAFAEAVAWAARALPTRPVIPVLAGLRLEASGGRLTLACFDYEVSARVAIPADVAEAGTALVPGRLLLEITRSLPGHPVRIGDDPDGVAMACGEAAFTLVTLPSDEYPALPDLPQLAGTADGGDFAVAIGQVTPAASKDDTLPLLTAVNLDLAVATMTLATTDRYRLAVRELGWAPSAGHEHAAVLVPARVLADAARMMSAGTPVRIMLREASNEAGAADGAMIGFEAGERRLTTRLLAGEFPRYRERFPAVFGCVAELDAEAFAEAVRRVSLVAERGTPVQLTFSDDRVTVAASTQGQARAREALPARFSGDEPAIAFSPHYLLDGIVAATSGTQHGAPAKDGEGGGGDDVAVRIQFTNSSKPAVITAVSSSSGDAAGGFRYLVVPQRVPR
jgi:DNA polymerase-3 subunit beta